MGYDINKDKNKNRTRVVVAVIIIIILLLLWFFGYYKEKVGKNLSFNYDADAKDSVEYKNIKLNKSKKKKIKPRVIENEESDEIEETVHELVDSLPVSRAVKKVMEKEEIVVTIRSSITQPSTIVPTKPVIKDDKEKEDKYIVNPHILAVYEYSESGDNFCISGEENTCKEIKNITPDYVYREDTIVKYEVKDGTILYFNIIKDNGDSITMQQTKNTVAGDFWSTTPQNSNGPTKILSALEDATSDWVYVKDQTYTEEEIFKNNFKTGCNIDNQTEKVVCDSNSYDLGIRQTPVKARMITVQEIENIVKNDTQSKDVDFNTLVVTKLFLINNLYQSGNLNGTEHYDKTYRGLVSDNTFSQIYGSPSIGYWTMSAQSGENTTSAWMVTTPNTSTVATTQNPTNAARAVIMVDKKEKIQTYNYNYNSHIKAVYKYNENGSGSRESYTGCLAGKEAGCNKIEVTKDTVYGVGDIIKYEVKDRNYLYFNVIKDNGNTLVLQQTNSTIENIKWYDTQIDSSESDVTKGPLTALSGLESKTSDWKYVNNLNYSIGDNNSSLGYSDCIGVQLCDATTYTLSRNNVKARMLTVGEAASLGCSRAKSSCKLFLSNYMPHSPLYVYNSFVNNYVLMNSSLSNIWTIITTGNMRTTTYPNEERAVRAVIEVNK